MTYNKLINCPRLQLGWILINL